MSVLKDCCRSVAGFVTRTIRDMYNRFGIKAGGRETMGVRHGPRWNSQSDGCEFPVEITLAGMDALPWA